MSINTVLYVDKNYEFIMNSGFTTAIIWTLHVHVMDPPGDNKEYGNIYYNNTKLASNGEIAQEGKDLIRKFNLIKNGGSVTRMLFCIGSADVSDFQNIQTLYDNGHINSLWDNFAAIVAAVNFDGFDFDMEEEPTDKMKETIVNLTLDLNHRYRKMITYCPYYKPTFWADCLSQVYTRNNSNQIVEWYNLQCYSGGASNTPSTWVQDLPKNAGIQDPAAFIIPGYDDSDCKTLEEKFQTCKTSDSGIQGGFYWRSSAVDPPNDLNDYSSAIRNGLA